MTDTAKTKTDLLDTFGLSGQGMVCLFGGGGKTSLMFTMADALSQNGKTVLTTTTTKIFLPSQEQAARTLICESAETLIKKAGSLLPGSRHICAGQSHDPGTGKVTGFSKADIKRVQKTRLFDWIIVEADGAKQKPIKSSAPHEPVFPQSCSHLILVVGLDAVDAPLDGDHVHRPEIFAVNTGLSMGEPLTATAIADALAIEMEKAGQSCNAGTKQIFLNKADSKKDVQNGRKIAGRMIDRLHVDSVIIGALHHAPVIKQQLCPPPQQQGVT